jgi:hypothetical protein
MADDVPPRSQNAEPSRKTLRLTFQSVDGEVRLVRQERLDMITPPSIGPRPEAGTNSGFWVELRDANGSVLSHRILHAPLRDSVEVYAPDGAINRVTGSPSDASFEVLLPDQGEASTAVLMGHDTAGRDATGRDMRAAASVLRADTATGSHELARFDLSR